MPIDYWSIIRRSFKLTIAHPLLWLLGLFLAGGFNANFFYLLNLRLHWRDGGDSLIDWAQYHINHSSHVIIASIVALGVIVLTVLVVNWAKTTFILQASNILQLKRLGQNPSIGDYGISQSIVESRRYLKPVIAMSLFTLACMVLLTGVLGGTPKLLFESRGAVWLIAALIFTVLIWFFSCLNIFATFFIIFYQRSFRSSLNLAWDLILSHWQPILELSLLLMIVYILCFFGGGSLVFLLKLMSEGALLSISRLGLVAGPVIFAFTTLLSALLLWLWLAAVNTFFNLCLLLLFTELVKPPHHPEFQSLTAELPAVRPEPATFQVDKSLKI